MSCGSGMKAERFVAMSSNLPEWLHSATSTRRRITSACGNLGRTGNSSMSSENPYKSPSELPEPQAARIPLLLVSLDIVAVVCSALVVAHQVWAYTVFQPSDRGPPFDFYR